MRSREPLLELAALDHELNEISCQRNALKRLQFYFLSFGLFGNTGFFMEKPCPFFVPGLSLP